MNNVKRNLAACLILCLALSLAGCAGESGSDSKVYQGTCLTMANDAKTLTLSNTEPKLNPIKGEKATFDLCKAKVGLLPEKGDVIRVAYYEQGKRFMAIKVMNVTKQDLRKK